VKIRAKYLLKSFAQFVCLLVAVSAIAGFAAPNEGNAGDDGTNGDGSVITTDTGTIIVTPTLVLESTVPGAADGGANVEPASIKKGNSFFTYLVFLVLFVLTGLGFSLIYKAVQEPKKNARRLPNYSNAPISANGQVSARPSVAQNAIKTRPQVLPVNSGPGNRTQIPRVERETIEILPIVETLGDASAEVEPEQLTARVRPNLVTADKPAAEKTPNILDEVSDRAIVKPPQIGDPSSFAKRNWWDPNVEWCQLSPLGMTSDITCDIGTVGSIALAAASLRGNKHKVDAKPCQDSFNVQSAIDKSGFQYVVSVLCDGMSSARYSHYGARRTSQVLSDALCRLIEATESVDLEFIKSNIENVLDFCRQKVLPTEVDLFGAAGVDLSDVQDSDFNTTVTFLIAPSTSFEKNAKAIVGCIGDSPIFVLHGALGTWEQIGVMGSADELVNPATAAFPGSIAIAIDEITLIEGDVLAAMSDGVGNFINVRGSQTTLGSYLAQQWSTPVNMATFVNDVSFDMKSADDDRTVVAIWRRI
jgi:hypothetical protein